MKNLKSYNLMKVVISRSLFVFALMVSFAVLSNAQTIQKRKTVQKINIVKKENSQLNNIVKPTQPSAAHRAYLKKRADELEKKVIPSTLKKD